MGVPPGGLAAVRPECVRCDAPKIRNASGKLYCRQCANKADRDRRLRGGDAIRARQRARHASNRERDNARSAARYRANRSAHMEEVRRWQSANRELVLASKRKWSKNNPAKAREYAARRRALAAEAVCEHGPDCVTAEVLAAIAAGRCTYCPSPATEADHYVPLARGGLHCVDNLVGACLPCNRSKGARLPDEWLEVRTA